MTALHVVGVWLDKRFTILIFLGLNSVDTFYMTVTSNWLEFVWQSYSAIQRKKKAGVKRFVAIHYMTFMTHKYIYDAYQNQVIPRLLTRFCKRNKRFCKEINDRNPRCRIVTLTKGSQSYFLRIEICGHFLYDSDFKLTGVCMAILFCNPTKTNAGLIVVPIKPLVLFVQQPVISF